MKAEGADLVIALAHTGIATGDDRLVQENAAIPLSRIDGIDVILCGHQHRLFPHNSFSDLPGVDTTEGSINGTPAMMSGFWGSHLGVMDLVLHQDASGKWNLRRHKTELRPVSNPTAQGRERETIVEAPEIVQAVNHYHQATLEYMQRPVGVTLKPLHSFLALVANDASVQLVARAQADYVARALENTRHAGLPILSAASPFKVGGRAGPRYYTDIPAGPLTLRSLADLYHFPNTSCALRLTGSQVIEWLERCASLFHRITPGLDGQALHDPQFPGYDFDHMIGLEYEIDPSLPARYSPEGRLISPDHGRITAVDWRGAPVDPDQEFIVATNSFRASGGGGFVQVPPEGMALSSKFPVRALLADYIKRQGSIDITPEPVWRFKTLPGTSARFKTALRAVDHLAEVPGRELGFDGTTEDGFALFRIDF